MATALKIEGSISESTTKLRLVNDVKNGWALEVKASSFPFAIAKLVFAISDSKIVPPAVKTQLLRGDWAVPEFHWKSVQGKENPLGDE